MTLSCSRKWPETARLLTPLLLFFASLLLFVLFRRPYIWEWDGFGYVGSVVLHERHTLVTGRWGTILFMIPFWEFHRLVLGLNPGDAWIATSQANMVASALSVVFLFLIVKQLFDETTAWMSAIFLAGSFGWVSYASANVSEMIMIASGTGGIYLFSIVDFEEPRVNWRDRRSVIRNAVPFLGAFLVGYSFLAREEGLTYFLFPCLILLFNFRRAWGRYGLWLFVFPLLMAVVGLSGIAYNTAKEGLGFLNTFQNPGTSVEYTRDILSKKSHFLYGSWVELFGLIPLLLSLVGLVVLVMYRKWKKTLLLISIILPSGLHILFGVMETRYYLIVLPPLAVLAAIGLKYPITYLWKNRTGNIAAIVLAACLVAGEFQVNAEPRIRSLNDSLASRRSFAESLLRTLPREGYFITGYNDVMIEFYRRIGVRPKWRPLHFSWGRPEDRAGDVEQALRRGQRVFIHCFVLSGTPEDREQLEEIKTRFVLSQMPGEAMHEILLPDNAPNH